MKVFRIGSVTGFRGRTDEQILRAFSLLLILCGLVLAIAACVKRPPKRVTMAEVEEILKRAGTLAESSFYACMLNYYAQGLSLQQPRDLCAIQLNESSGRTKIPGGPSEGYAGIGDHSKPFFDHANIV